MKRHIFWLFFSCLTATTFLSYSMEEGDTNGAETSEQAITPAQLYPTLQNEEAKGTIAWLCDDLKLITKKELKKYLGAQVAALIDTLMEDGDFEEFIAEAFNDLFKTINKEQVIALMLEIQQKYLPELVNESIEDAKMNLLVILALEKAFEYAAKAAITTTEKDSLWNDEVVLEVLRWSTNNMPRLTNWAVNKYIQTFPLITSVESDKINTNNNDQRLLTVQSIQASNYIKNLETQQKSLILELQQAKARLTQASSSPGMHRIEGGIIGFGLLFFCYMISRAICEPCVEHFEPGSTFSLIWAFAGVIGTLFCLRYVHSSKTVPMLLGKIGGNTAAVTIKTAVKANNLLEKLEASDAKEIDAELNPSWKAFDKTCTREQTDLLSPEDLSMFEGIHDNDINEIKNFLDFYKEYCNFLSAVKNKEKITNSQRSKFSGFTRFLNSINKNPKQKELWNTAKDYLYSQYSNKSN